MGNQLSLKGGVCQVPIELSPMVNQLPRTLDESETVMVKIKRRMTYKHAVISENIRPLKIITALHYLMENITLFSRVFVNS